MCNRVYDEARFEKEDEASVVMASFACGACLSAAELVILSGEPGERIATSHCSSCGTRNVVAVSDAQAHQLRMVQRGNAFVHFAPEYW
jgi:transcription elongation factor Elf1